MDFQMPDLSWLFDPDNVTSVARAIGVVLPIIMTVITKTHVPTKIKAAVLAALSGVVAFIAPILVGVGVPSDLRELVNGALNAAVVAVLVQIGILKPTGLSDLIAEKTANFGFDFGHKDEPVDEPDEGGNLVNTVPVEDETPVETDAEETGEHESPKTEPPVDEVPVDHTGSLVENAPDSDEPVEDVIPDDLLPEPADETDPTDAELAELDELSSEATPDAPRE